MKSVSQHSVLLCSLQHYSQLPRYRNNYLLINEWIKKENVRERYIDISSGTSFSLKKQILPFLTTWINMEDVMLSEVRHRNINTA